MKPVGINAVAFDIDGTLYPNYRLYSRLLPFILTNPRLMRDFGKARKILHHIEWGGKSPPGAHYVAPTPHCGGTGLPPQRPPSATIADEFHRMQAELVAEYSKKSPEETNKKIESFIYGSWQNHFKHIKPFPRVRQTIEKFRQRGLKTAAMSDFPIGRKLEFMKLDGIWDVELCTEDFGALKPALKPFQSLSNALQTPPEGILYVGNSVRFDIAGAKNSGMRAALIRRLPSFSGAGGADFIFRDYRQLERFVLD
jgi:putative hydrolase of the HAD superfamily